ncbi:MMPL family transporter [Nocardia sp. MW-W600-9]
MFTRWGDLVYRFRFAVIGILGAALLALGAYGTGLGDRLTSSGWFDPGSESVQGAEIADGAFGRDHMADVIVMYNAPEGKTIDDPVFSQKVVDSLTKVVAENPEIDKINGTYWKVGDAPSVPSTFGSKDKKHAFASIAIVGNDDTTMMANYRAIQDVFYIPGEDVEVSGLQAIAVTLNDTIAHDTKRMELLAIPAVAVLLFFIFGGIVAAALPLIIGGLTIIGATGIVMALTNFTEVNSFVTGVVSMIGLGLAIDYGLFIVSRFREELAEGYDTRVAVRRSVMTAGRTVIFSATMIVASLGGILLFPQGFLRSVAYGTIATVSLAALTAVTLLPAMLAILGPRVDMLGLKRFRKTKTAEQIENGFWGNLTRWVMKHPLKIAIPITIGLLLLIIPVKDLAFGGINEKYLPPDNQVRSSLEHFYEVFPQKKTDPIQLVFTGADTTAIGQVWKEANQAPGLVGPFGVPTNPQGNTEVWRTSATLVDPTDNAQPTIDYLRSIEVPDGITMYVTGQPALMADSIDTLLDLMPLMIVLVLLTTTVLMFLTFGSLVLPIKAALMSALGLGSTLGILTWIFVDGNGAGLLNFTPQPISAPVLMLIIAIIYGLSTDYEVFLLSRMVEARAQGASTTEAVRIGTAQTGRIITAAALILLVVTGAFAFSDLVMMQYIAYGMIAALFIDATVLRMLLVPAIMKLLGDDCWWAPKWMKRIQEKIGLGEPMLDDERPQKGAVVDLVKTTPITDPPTMQMTVVPDSKLAKTPRRPRTVAEIEAEAPTAHLDKITEHTDPAEPARPRPPMSPDPTRPRAAMLSGEPTRVLPVVKPGAEPPKPEPDSAANAPETTPPPMFTSGEPTQILPVVKPGAEPPKPEQGPDDAAPEPEAPRDDVGFLAPEANPAAPGDSGVIGGESTGPAIDGVIGGLDLPPTGRDTVPPRGASRVQPPAGFSPSTPRVSPPGDASGFGTPAEDSGSRPSIVPPARPSIVNPQPRGVVPPPAPSIVNTPPPGVVPPPAPSIVSPPPSIVTPTPRPVEPPAGGTFSGFTPLTGFEPTAREEQPEPEPRSSASSSDDLSVAPGAHRAESPAGDDVARTEPDEPRGVFGTPIPVEPPQPTSPWNGSPAAPNGFTAPESASGPWFSPVTPSPEQDSAPPVRPQVAPPGFTAVASGEPTPAVEPAPQAEPAEPQSNPSQWRAPDGFTAVPAPTPATPAEPEPATDDSAPDADEPQADNRNEIENWMAQLRSSRRGTAADEGRHSGNEGRTVSVNELLRRREDDAD